MSTEEIQQRIQTIREIAGDPEGAHSEEDALRKAFIRYVASLDDLPSLAAKANLILTTEEIKFDRWCA